MQMILYMFTCNLILLCFTRFNWIIPYHTLIMLYQTMSCDLSIFKILRKYISYFQAKITKKCLNIFQWFNIYQCIAKYLTLTISQHVACSLSLSPSLSLYFSRALPVKKGTDHASTLKYIQSWLTFYVLTSHQSENPANLHDAVVVASGRTRRLEILCAFCVKWGRC